MLINWVFCLHFAIVIAIGHWVGNTINPALGLWAQKVECLENRSPADENNIHCQQLLKAPVRAQRLNKNKNYL
jgi:hypothetical protein